MLSGDRGANAGRATGGINWTVERAGRYLAYAYVLRVPLGIWLFLIVFPLLAVSSSSVAPLLRGIFDLAQPRLRATLSAHALVALASFLAGMSVAVTTRLILLDGRARFGLGRIPRRLGVALLFRVVPLIATPSWIFACVMYGARKAGSNVALWTEFAGFAIGAILFRLFVSANLWIRRAIEGPPSGAAGARGGTAGGMAKLASRVPGAALLQFGSPTASGQRFAALASVLVGLAAVMAAKSPQGYMDGSGKLKGRHVFAVIQFELSLIFYAVLFFLKRPVRADSLPIPTLCLVLVFAMLVCWSLSAMTFFLDRFRIPLLAVLSGYVLLTSSTPQSDHFYRSIPRSTDRRPPTAAEILRLRAGLPVILVAASGGGIQAEAWTALVLAGIAQELEQNGLNLSSYLTLVSSVSGGSVGAMHFLGTYRDGILPPVGKGSDALVAYPPVQFAQRSSLAEVTWGLVYDDLIWGLFPYLKGIDRRHLLYGRNLTSDRGRALEEAWDLAGAPKGGSSGRGKLRNVGLATWQEAARAGTLPAVIFNATIVETGARLLLGTTTLARERPLCETGELDPSEKVGRVEFFDLYGPRNRDVPIPTAVRLSATFPYVTPAARILGEDVFDHEFHIVDGGYYDNFGVSTLLEWLDSGLRDLTGDNCSHELPERILLVQIRASKETVTRRPPRNQGGFFQFSAPLRTLMSVRDTAQLSRNDFAVKVASERWLPTIEIESFEFEYEGGLLPEDAAPPDAVPGEPCGERASSKAPARDEAPLSWHLTAKEKRALACEWDSPRTQKNRRALVDAVVGAMAGK